MYLFIYVGRALHCHKNIDITDMMHSDESFPLELYKCFVYHERRGVARSDWSDICHLLSSFVCSALIVSVCCEHVPGAALSQLSQPQTCHSVQSMTQLFSISLLFLTFS